MCGRVLGLPVTANKANREPERKTEKPNFKNWKRFSSGKAGLRIVFKFQNPYTSAPEEKNHICLMNFNCPSYKYNMMMSAMLMQMCCMCCTWRNDDGK